MFDGNVLDHRPFRSFFVLLDDAGAVMAIANDQSKCFAAIAIGWGRLEARVVADQSVRMAAFLDLAMVMGTGFAPFRGGILRYADTVGVAALREQLEAHGDGGVLAIPIGVVQARFELPE